VPDILMVLIIVQKSTIFHTVFDKKLMEIVKK